MFCTLTNRVLLIFVLVLRCTMDNREEEFQSVTIFVLATNETELLKETVDRLISTCSDEDLEKIVIVLKDEHCPSCNAAKEIIKTYNSTKIEIYFQKSSTVELCISELPKLVKSTHFIIMVADMEMDSSNISTFISRAKKHPKRIICAAKWLKDSTVEGYGLFHELGSRLMNSFISVLFLKNVKDPFSIYQIYPTSVYRRMNFNNDSKFAYEYTIKPLRNDVEYEEISTVYKKRSEGKSNFNYIKLFQTAISFCFTAIRIRFSPKEGLLSEDT